jgi:hypothetical protein
LPIHQFIHGRVPAPKHSLRTASKRSHSVMFLLTALLLLLSSQILAVAVVIACCVGYCLCSRFCSHPDDPLQTALNDAINKDGPSAPLTCAGTVYELLGIV